MSLFRTDASASPVGWIDSINSGLQPIAADGERRSLQSLWTPQRLVESNQAIGKSVVKV
jgi:hypothetical protein